MDSSSGSSFSSTISSPSPPTATTFPKKQIVSGTRIAQCTHTTVTRLYTTEFRCSFCLKPPTMGWLWRCTQDRELLIEDDLEHDKHEHLDALSNSFPHPESPRKLSPAARTTGLTFLNEVTEDQFKQYTTEQILKIMEQRAEVQRMANASTNPFNPDCLDIEPRSPGSEADGSLLNRFSMSSDASQKPWLPNMECQFKCCQRCRPNNRERSYLSMDAIANGEYQPTAVTGFGFHLTGKRPVVSAEILRNIGLRPSPKPKDPMKSPPKRRRPRRNSIRGATFGPNGSSPFNDDQSADTTFSQPPAANFYDSTAMTRSLNVESSRNGSSTPDVIQAVMNLFSPRRRQSSDDKNDTNGTPNGSKKELPSDPAKASSPLLRNAVIDTPSAKGGMGKLGMSQRRGPVRRSTDSELSHLHSTHSEDSDIGLQYPYAPSTPTRPRRSYNQRVRNIPPPGHKRAASQISEINSEDQPGARPKPLTPMEEKEKRGGYFGNQPLEVDQGVAVTEESLALHVPDVITQF